MTTIDPPETKPTRPRAVTPTRLRRRLAVAFVLAVGVATGALALGSYLVVRNARLDDSARSAVNQSILNLRYATTQPSVQAVLDGLRTRGQFASVALTTGHPAQQSGAIGADRIPAALRQLVSQGQLARQRITVAGRPYLVVGGALPQTSEQLYFFYDEHPLWADLDVLRNVLAIGWLILVLLAGLGGTLFARRTLAPVAQASDAARSLAEGLLDTRLPIAGDDEFGAWAASFNDMAEALETKIQALADAQARERRFTADVAHDLRTPLTALIGEARQLAYQVRDMPADGKRLAAMLVADVDRLCRLTDDLLEISRLDSGEELLETELVEVGAVVDGVVRGHGWADTVAIEPAQVMITTDRRRLERIVANLIGNAVTHAGVGVHVHVHRDGDEVVIAVSDDGPGIPTEALPNIFDRFHKADRSRSTGGSGLGLAIAYENARLLGGGITAVNAPGAGAVFALRLPVGRPVSGGDGQAIVEAAGHEREIEPTREERR